MLRKRIYTGHKNGEYCLEMPANLLIHNLLLPYINTHTARVICYNMAQCLLYLFINTIYIHVQCNMRDCICNDIVFSIQIAVDILKLL